MRTFISTYKHDRRDFPDQPDISLNLFHADNLIELFEKINHKCGDNCILYNKGNEEDMLDQINESNGDGDYRFIIGELINNELKILVE